MENRRARGGFLHALFAQFVDEVAANILLHCYLRYRRAPAARGPRPGAVPELYSGSLESFYSPRPEPIDLTVSRIPIEDTPSFAMCDFRFESSIRLGWPDSDCVWCRHWKAREFDRGVTVVGLDGLVQLGSGWYRRLAAKLLPHGVDVLMMDAPFNFRRTPGGYRPGQLIVGGDLAHQLAVTRQAVIDVWQVVQSLQNQGRRVGLVGVSYGAWLTLLTALLAEHLDFLIAVVPPVDIVRMLHDGGTMVRGIRRGIGFGAINAEELARLARPVVPSHWKPKLAADRIVLHAARYDRFVPCKGIEELAGRWGTRLVVHNEAHYRLAVSPQITPLVASQVLELSGKAHPTIFA